MVCTCYDPRPPYLYRFFSMGSPNKMLSRTVPLITHGVCAA